MTRTGGSSETFLDDKSITLISAEDHREIQETERNRKADTGAQEMNITKIKTGNTKPKMNESPPATREGDDIKIMNTKVYHPET